MGPPGLLSDAIDVFPIWGSVEVRAPPLPLAHVYAIVKVLVFSSICSAIRISMSFCFQRGVFFTFFFFGHLRRYGARVPSEAVMTLHAGGNAIDDEPSGDRARDFRGWCAA